MAKTLINMLAMLRKAGVGEVVDTSRTEIKLRKSGNMQLSVTHQSSGVLATVTVQPDYTISDEDADAFDREIAPYMETTDDAA